jgi:hypothetical protein
MDAVSIKFIPNPVIPKGIDLPQNVHKVTDFE